MKYRIVLTPDARADIGSAVHWYQGKDPDAAFRFLLETQATINRIKQYPKSFPFVRGALRRAVLDRFPFSIYFYLKNEIVSVIAVVHQRRRDITWLSRGNGHRVTRDP